MKSVNTYLNRTYTAARNRTSDFVPCRVELVLSEVGDLTVKKKGQRGVRFEGCYSPGSVMATHKGVELTSWGCWQAALGC